MSLRYSLLKELIKGIVNPKMKICWIFTHPQAIQDVEEFVSSSDLERCSIPSLAHQWILCSEWVPSEWESKQLLKTSQWSTNNPHHSSPSINILWSEKLHVCKKQTHHYSLILLSPVKKSHLVWIRREICTDQALFTSQNGPKQL